MDEKKIKSALKDAREAIKAKDFQSAFKACKNILRSDKDHYMALVFLGVSMQEIGQSEQAPHAFKKAITVDPNQQLAWNGLASYFEKQDNTNAKKELTKIYEKLLNLERDTGKYGDLCSKLVSNALKLEEVEESANILYNLTRKQELSEYNRRTTWLALASLLIKFPNLSAELVPKYAETLATVVKERTSVTYDYYKEYLKLLYKLKDYQLLLTEALCMHRMYETNLYPLEWMCRVFCESAVENNEEVKNYISDIELYITKLMIIQEDSVLGMFAKAILDVDDSLLIDASTKLQFVVDKRPSMVHAWTLLAKVLYNLHRYVDASEAVFKADQLLKSMTIENVVLRGLINRCMVVILARHPSKEMWVRSVELGQEILRTSENEEHNCILMALLLAFTNLGNYDEAEAILDTLDPHNVGTVSYYLAKAQLLGARGDPAAALNLLNELNADSDELYVNRGVLYWQLGQYEKCLVPFLKAAKLDPNNYMCFVYLARYYEYIKDTDKARRCYQKAFKINPRCMEAGMHLSNIYRQQKNWAANFELLQSVTGVESGSGLSVINPDVKWAWMQLGLHYFDQGDFTAAIDILRSVIRVEPNNSHYWECLADAYMARGAYTAALRSYERAAELAKDTLYPKLQLATIKLMLGHFEEANNEFTELLKQNQRYVPALKGLAESNLNLAYSQYQGQMMKVCRSTCQDAINSITIALEERGDLSCLWKQTGDICLLVTNLPDKYSFLYVKTTLAEGRESEDASELSKLDLYILTARCYCKAINLSTDNFLFWHDLAVCYYSHGNYLKSTKGKSHLERALSIAMFCVTKNPGYWYHWNLLGTIAVHKDVKKYYLAQHAFIKAVTIENNSAMAWANLGTLYLILGDIKLANKAYSQAQRGEPDYINCWIGQAVIAELIGSSEAMDLFRHTTQLGYHSQSVLGYAHWVCRTLIEKDPYGDSYSICNMYAIPVACDGLTWFTEHNPKNPCAWNLLGVLRERMGLKNSALEAFKLCMEIVEEERRDKVLINMARIFVNLEQYDEAIALYRQIKQANFNGGCGLALALFKAKQFEESYESYDTTMQWLTENENLQSHVLVALAAMAYMFQGPDSAKTLLFQSTVLKPPSKWGLFATLALGLLHEDITLAKLVLKELQNIKYEPEVIPHYGLLHSLTFWIQNDKKNAVRSLCRMVHYYPTHPMLLLYLTNMLLKADPKSKGHVAENFAYLAMKFGRSQMDISKVLCILSFACYISKAARKALSYAQKAVHCYPHAAEGWAMLISTVKLYANEKTNWKRQYDWIQDCAKHVIDNLSPSEDLSAWILKFALHN